MGGECPAAPAVVLAQCTATSQRCAGRHRSHLINTGRRERCAGRLIEPMGHSLTVRTDSISQNIDSATLVFRGALGAAFEGKEVVILEMRGLNLKSNSTLSGHYRCFSHYIICLSLYAFVIDASATVEHQQQLFIIVAR